MAKEKLYMLLLKSNSGKTVHDNDLKLELLLAYDPHIEKFRNKVLDEFYNIYNSEKDNK